MPCGVQDFNENKSQSIITIAIITNSITLTTEPLFHTEPNPAEYDIQL